MKRLWLALLVTLAAAPVAAADRELTVTVYNQNLGLVKDVRSLELGTGKRTFRLTDVSAQIDPTSVHLVPTSGGGLSVLEQNFQYDLVSADKVLDRYVDKPITVIGKDGKSTTGTLLSFDGGSLVLNRDPGIAIVNRLEVKEIQFPDLPGGLITKPTLVWTIDNDGPATREAQLSYLTGGLSWHAEYVAVVDESDKNLSWSGWVSLENTSGTTYPDARLKLVAGDVNRVTNQPAPVPREMFAKATMATDQASQFEEQGFFEYHLYSLTRPTTLADKETKQLSLFPTANVQAQKFYTFERTRDPSQGAGHDRVQERDPRGARHAAAQGRGARLQGGQVGRAGVRRRGPHRPHGEGRDRAHGDRQRVRRHGRVPPGRPAPDLGREVEGSHEIKIRNHKTEAITVKVVERA